MSPQNVKIACRLLKSDQFCRCLATSTWSFPQRALGWPRILGAVLSVGSRALATQASETKLRSCVTSNLSQMEKKLSRTLLLQANFFYSFLLLVLKDVDLSRFKVEAFTFLFCWYFCCCCCCCCCRCSERHILHFFIATIANYTESLCSEKI